MIERAPLLAVAEHRLAALERQRCEPAARAVRANGGSRSCSPKVPSVVDCSRICPPRASVKRSGPRRSSQAQIARPQPDAILRLVHLDARGGQGWPECRSPARTARPRVRRRMPGAKAATSIGPASVPASKAGRGPLDRAETRRAAQARTSQAASGSSIGRRRRARGATVVVEQSPAGPRSGRRGSRRRRARDAARGRAPGTRDRRSTSVKRTVPCAPRLERDLGHAFAARAAAGRRSPPDRAGTGTPSPRRPRRPRWRPRPRP